MKYERLSSLNYKINNTFPVIKTIDSRNNDFKIEVVKIKDLGKALVINKDLQLIDSQAHRYHEPMAHTPAAYLDNPVKALILGGGDGGICHELLKYNSIKNITIVEISKDVVELSKKHFPSFANSLENEKVNLIQDNAKLWLEKSTEKFDLIYIDTTELGDLARDDPETTLKNQNTLKACKKLLNPKGILTQNDFFCGVENFMISSSLANAKNVFNNCSIFVANIPYFPAQTYSFLMMSKETDFDNHIIKWKKINTIFYNRETHLASLARDQESKTLGNLINKSEDLVCSTTLIDFNGVDEKLINQEDKVLNIMKAACNEAGLNIINSLSHKFTPHGITCSILLKESHFTCHSWPEYNKIYFDLNTCGDVDKARIISDILTVKFNPVEKSIKNNPRY